MVEKKKDFVKYFFVAIVLVIISIRNQFSLTYSLFENLAVIEVTSAVLAGFSFYFYLFNKDKLALKIFPVLIGISLAINSFTYALTITEPTFVGYFTTWIWSILGFFIGGIVIYAYTFVIFWIYKKVKKLLERFKKK